MFARLHLRTNIKHADVVQTGNWGDYVLVTPSLATGVLPGVTRGAVAALARRAGYRIREGSFTLPALLRAEEAFTSSAVREIMPVIAVDGREIPRGAAAAKIQGLLEHVTDEYPGPDG